MGGAVLLRSMISAGRRRLEIFWPRMRFIIKSTAAMPSRNFGWRTVVGAEIVFGVAGSNGGLGWYINNASYFLNPPAIFAGLVVISLLGVLLDTLFQLVERQTIVKWGMKQGH